MLQKVNPVNCEDDGLTIKANLGGQASFSGDAVLSTSYDADFVVRGNAFIFEKNFSILTGASLFVLVDYTTWTPDADQLGQVFALPPVFSASGGPVVVNVFRGTDYAGGTEFDCINPNTLAPKLTTGTTFTFGATGSNKGTKVLEYLIGGGSGASGRSESGATTGLEFFIRDTSGKTLVEIINQSGAEVIFHYGQIFFEI